MPPLVPSSPPEFVQNLPKSFYRAKNLGVTHETELIGYPHDIVIENLEPAPLTALSVSSVPAPDM